MDRQQVGVMLVLEDGLGLKFDISCFNDRLICQKAIYLAQAVGINLGYYYHWYLHGPYCSSLTKDGYDINTEIQSREWDEWQLDEASRTKLKKIRRVFDVQDRKQLASKIELFASVHFLIDRKRVTDRNVTEITDTLRRFDKPFDESQVRKALEELESYEFLR
ncbi:MAG: hypothetical protein KAQ89_01690 [Planctomycetes bacterium]|nr:hypothetical protein [Planctomycetota bacterium]